MVDNSSAWRMDPDVPLVVSEVNPEALDGHRGHRRQPQLHDDGRMLPLKALHDVYGLAGWSPRASRPPAARARRAWTSWPRQVPGLLADPDALAHRRRRPPRRRVEHSVHADTLAFNVVPLLGARRRNGYTDEEMKLRNESRKILDIPDLAVSPTCVRVPVMVGHAVEIRATFERDGRPRRGATPSSPPSRAWCSRTSPRRWSGPAATRRPSAACARDLADPEHALNLFVVGDNLLKGAALNTVQIAELLHERGLIGSRAAA